VKAFKVVHEQIYFVFLHKKYIHSYNFYLPGTVNKFLDFCVAYFRCWFLKMAIILSHGHFLLVAFVSILVFQTFENRIIFGRLTSPGTRWYVLTVQDHKWYTIRKFGNHYTRACSSHTGDCEILPGGNSLQTNTSQTYSINHYQSDLTI